MNVLLAVLWKDLVTEWRSRDRVVSMLLFSLLVVVTFHFALPPLPPEQARSLAPGLLWVATVFAALLGLGRAFALELENDALAGLSLAPADRGWIFLGKALANAALIFAVQLVTAAAVGLAFDVPVSEHAAALAIILWFSARWASQAPARCSAPSRSARGSGSWCSRSCCSRCWRRW